MQRRTAWLSGVAAAALLAGVSAPRVSSAAPIPRAFSYADLLDPVPDASARLAVDDARHEQQARLQTVQWRRGGEHHHHHHHHHHHAWQDYPANGYYGYGGGYAVTPYYTQPQGWYGAPAYAPNPLGWTAPYRDHHHHHHHHHHHNQWNYW